MIAGSFRSRFGAGTWTARCVVAALAARPAAAEVDPAVLAAEAARVAVVERASSYAVAVFATRTGGGSGVVISPDGYALSNFHVTREAGDAMKCGMADGRLYDAVIVGIDPTGDVALIKLLGRDDFPHAEMADSDTVRTGDWCFAIGNPFLLATDFKPTVTYGVDFGRPPLPVSRRHAAGICRLPAGRRGDQSRQFRRPAVRRRRAG